jgi:hypothetical protein
MPTWSARALATSRTPSPRIDVEHPQNGSRDAIWAARQVFTLGVGVNNANARNFTYLASTGMERVLRHPAPRQRPPPTIWPGPIQPRRLIAMTCKPYRREVVEAVEHRPRAGRQGDRHFRQPGLARHHRFGVRLRRQRRHAAVLSVFGVDHRLLETLLSFVIAVPLLRSSSGWSSSTVAAMNLGHLHRQARSANVNDISASPIPIRSLEARYYTDPEIFRIERRRAAGAHLAIRRPCFSLVEKPGDYFTFDYRRREPVLHSRPRW